ncbi:FAD-binding oxidoreductase [Thalassotalea sp. M1531]|uniref:FAD-binding oxidoreductase n=1 Tax=Thalassotalea algicola TaxID=2716224 RepID=A0A7Y0Q5A5_9GAMM|nr:FAD-binding oxidoreductase [Thalassotalea algicola]NMP30108.1 FAD-binding oxidoreductase [Thalassotalea algicola]
MSEQLPPQSQSLFDALSKVLDADNVSEESARRVLMSQDVFTKSIIADYVIKPQNTQQLAQAIKLCQQAGYAVIARGGGMSYTKGFVPATEKSVIVDMSSFDQIVEINTDDMYVTVGAGCTWQQVYLALKDTGFRTPFWGTLSGIRATIGGGLSQNAIFWGSGQHGFAVDSVLGLEVVLSNGQVLQTGAGAKQNGSPFLRHYGPDLTGIFCGDSAAFAIKTQVTLRLIKQSPYTGSLSFCFENFEQQSAVMSEVARNGLASECFGFDPFLQAQRLKRESLASDVKSLVGVMKSAGGIGKGLKEGMKVALAGRRFVEAESWSVHFMVEDITQAGVDERLARIRQIAEQHAANEIENTIPKVLRANPFNPLNNMIGPNGERWAPVHTLVPHSKAKQAHQISEAIFSKYSKKIAEFGIGIGYLVATVSSHVFVLEPVFFWPDELNELHNEAVESAHLKRLEGFKASPEARAVVSEIRLALIDGYNELGGVHMQIGKSYPFIEGIAKENRALIKGIKALLDSDGLINPKALGL